MPFSGRFQIEQQDGYKTAGSNRAVFLRTIYSNNTAFICEGSLTRKVKGRAGCDSIIDWGVCMLSFDYIIFVLPFKATMK